MKCPHCKKELEIPWNSKVNMENYHDSCITVTKCCGKAVCCCPEFSFTAEKYIGEEKEDDWGNPIKI